MTELNFSLPKKSTMRLNKVLPLLEELLEAAAEDQRTTVPFE